MTGNRGITKDTQVALMWFVGILIGGFIGISIIFRDMNDGFGTVTFGPTNDFNYMSDSGELFSSEKLSGKVWIGHRINSDCIQKNEYKSYVNMYASIHEALKDNEDITMISFINGDKEMLDKIKSKYTQKSEKWKILLTPKSDHFNIQNYQSRQDENAFIVDQNGIIRGIYNMSFINEAKKLIKDIKKLI